MKFLLKLQFIFILILSFGKSGKCVDQKYSTTITSTEFCGRKTCCIKYFDICLELYEITTGAFLDCIEDCEESVGASLPILPMCQYSEEELRRIDI